MQLHRTVPDYSRRIFGRKLSLLLLLLLLLEATVLSCCPAESPLLGAEDRAARALAVGRRPARHHSVVVVGLVPGPPPGRRGRDSLRHPWVALNSGGSSSRVALNSGDSSLERLLLLLPLNLAPVPEVVLLLLLLLLLLLTPDHVDVAGRGRGAAAGRVVDREQPLLERLLLLMRGRPRGRRRAGDGVADAGALRGEGRRGGRQHRRTWNCNKEGSFEMIALYIVK